MNALAEKEFHFSDADFKFLASLVKEKTGIVLAEHKRDMVYGRLARRLRALRLTRFDEYCKLVQSDDSGGEMLELVNAITTNLTRFFREPHHFGHLKKVVVPELVKRHKTSGRVRFWSAGCSMGMEAYSMAMVMHSGLPRIDQWDLKILATDIDTNVLNIGSNGVYKKEILTDIPEEYKARYIEEEGGDVRVSENVRKLVAFKQLNFLQPNWPLKGPFDAIFCRNVVIYFDKPTQRVIFNKMADLLKTGGFLYIGHSENLFQVTDRFKLIGRTIYTKEQ